MLGVGIAKFTPHPLVTQERWIADDDVRLRPLRLDGPTLLVVPQDGVHRFDVVQAAEDGAGDGGEAVVVQPLEVADPDHDLGQLVGVGVDFDAVELLRLHLGEPGRQAVLGGKGDDGFLQVQ